MKPVLCTACPEREGQRDRYHVLHVVRAADIESAPTMQSFIIAHYPILCNLQLVNEMKTYVETMYCDPNLTLESVADRVLLSSGYFGKLFKNITGIQFNEYLNNIRMEKAKELLLSTSDNIDIVCEKVGILNRTYFYTLFKKTFGITPSQFRKQLRI